MLQDKQPSFFNNKKMGAKEGGGWKEHLFARRNEKTNQATKMCQPYLDPNLEKL